MKKHGKARQTTNNIIIRLLGDVLCMSHN